MDWDSLFDSEPSTSLNSPSETERPNSGGDVGPADTQDSIPSGIDALLTLEYLKSVGNLYEQQPVAGGNGQLQNAYNPIDQQNREPLHTPENDLTTLNLMDPFYDGNQSFDANAVEANEIPSRVPCCSEDIRSEDIIQSLSTRREGDNTDDSADNTKSTREVPNGPTGEKGGRPPKIRDTTVGKCDHHESSVGKSGGDVGPADTQDSILSGIDRPPVHRKRNPRPKKVLTPEQKKAKSQTERNSRINRIKKAVKQAVDTLNRQWTKRWNKRNKRWRNLQKKNDRLQEESDLWRKRYELCPCRASKQ